MKSIVAAVGELAVILLYAQFVILTILAASGGVSDDRFGVVVLMWIISAGFTATHRSMNRILEKRAA